VPTAGSPITTPDDVRTREDLGAALTSLRLASGLSVRDVARRTGLPLATVGGYLSGRHLPPLATLDQFESLLAALAVADDEVPAWLAVVARLRRVPGPRPASAIAPYLGLRAYQAADSSLFFGRETLTEHLVELITSSPSTPVVVVGSSGSGKSSVLRAGVQARLVAAGTPVTVVTPGTEPTSIVPDVEAGTPRGVLIVDQFEELFTASLAAESVADVVSRLGRLHAAGTTVVIALRADFFDAAVHLPDLADWLTANQALVGPLGIDDLRRVVTEPAQVVGVELDDGLVELLIADATAGSSTRAGMDAGALPLASHALYVTWLAASGRRLGLEQYRQVGRLAGAIAQTAEAVHNDLPDEAEAVERSTLLRLVRVGAGTVDTRRVADAHEFTTAEQRAVIDAYVVARLLTSDRGRVQIAHEALLSAWPRMRAWLDADREGLRVHGRLTDAARRWQELDQDPDLLYRGAALEGVDRWLGEAANRPVLTPGEREFVNRSSATELSRATAQRRSTIRLRALAVGMAVLVVATATLAGVSARQARASDHQTDLAVSRQLAVQAEALAATDPALAGQLAVAADQRAETVEARSALLSASARDAVVRTDSLDAVTSALAVSPDGASLAAGTGDGRVVLEATADHGRPLASLTPGDTALYSAQFSPDGTLLAAVGDAGLVHLWDVRDPAAPQPVSITAPAANATYYDVTFTPDGTRVIAGASDGTVHVITRGADGWSQTQTFPATQGTVQGVAINPTGTMLATAGSDATVSLWSVSNTGLTPLGAAFKVATTKVTSLAFSPDGSTLAAGSTDDHVYLWDVHTPTAPVAGLDLTGPTSWTNRVEFSPDGKAIAAASSDQHLWVWDATTGIRLDSFIHPTTLLTAAWSPDGTALYSAGSDGVLRTWRYPGATLAGFGSSPGQAVFGARVIATATKDGMRLFDASGGPHTLLSVSPAPGEAHLDGAIGVDDPLHLVVAGDTAGNVHFWDIADPKNPVYRGAVAAHTDWVEAVAFDTTGTRMAVSSDDASVTTWDLSGALPTAPTGRVSDLGGAVYAVWFAPDNTALVASILSGSVDLLDTTNLANPTLIGAPLTGPKGYVYSAAFSPDGRTVAASGNDNTIWLWDVTDRHHPVPLGQPLVWADGYGMNLAFSPDGHLLAAGMTDGTVRIWDVSTPSSPLRYASLTGVSGKVYGVAFSADGSQVSGAGSDRTVRIWDLDPQQALTTVCTPARAGRAMTHDEWSRLAGELARPTLCD